MGPAGVDPHTTGSIASINDRGFVRKSRGQIPDPKPSRRSVKPECTEPILSISMNPDIETILRPSPLTAVSCLWDTSLAA
jgi:hypothetical protein